MSEHERLLIEAIKKLEQAGFRVIRLDHEVVPDAIAIKNNKVIAVEASTDFANIYLTKRKMKHSQYDEEIIVTKPFDQRYHKPEVYYKVLELAKKKKHSLRQIRKIVMVEFGLKALSVSTVHDWIKGQKKPLTLLNTISKSE